MTDPSRLPVAARRAALGFANGAQVLSLRLAEEQLNALKQALQEGREGWHEVEATDGAVLVDLDEVAYLRVESGEHRVGF
jgi:hypothetical protein